MISSQRPLYPAAHLDGLLRRLRGLDIEEEGLPSHVEHGRLRVLLRGLACGKLLHGALEVPLSDVAPGTHVVADNLNTPEYWGSDESNQLTAAKQQVVAAV